MRLREWLMNNDMNATELADEIDFNKVYIQQVCKGTKVPGRHLIAILANFTKNEVKASDWLKTRKGNNAHEVKHRQADSDKKDH